jgi:hypothetical protein
MRARRHRQGDHSMCKRNCQVSKAPVRLAAVGEVPLDYPVDVQVSLRALARRLEAAHEADPGNSALAKELRQTLLVLGRPGDAAGRGPDVVDRLRAELDRW